MNKENKKSVYAQFVGLAFALALTPSLHAESLTYQCGQGETGGQPREILISNSGQVRIPSEEGKLYSGLVEVKPGEVEAIPPGHGGRLFENGTGPGYWVYRIPQALFEGQPKGQVIVRFDADADGFYSDDVLTCVRE